MLQKNEGRGRKGQKEQISCLFIAFFPTKRRWGKSLRKGGRKEGRKGSCTLGGEKEDVVELVGQTGVTQKSEGKERNLAKMGKHEAKTKVLYITFKNYFVRL